MGSETDDEARMALARQNVQTMIFNQTNGFTEAIGLLNDMSVVLFSELFNHEQMGNLTFAFYDDVFKRLKAMQETGEWKSGAPLEVFDLDEASKGDTVNLPVFGRDAQFITLSDEDVNDGK